MKKVLLRIVGIFLALFSIALVCYPFISNYLMEMNQASEILTYEEKVNNTADSTLEDERARAEEYNKNFTTQVILTDPFDPAFVQETDYEYESLLNLNGDSIMGSVNIPSIGLKLPIYHGTSKEVLEKGAGHLTNTSLPIGGTSTHAVITGHTGLPVTKLFTDLDRLKVGDMFFINTLGDTLAYEIDKITVVKPSETDELRVVDGEDYVTLITCTPYGINTHRLLVRGKRVEYNPKMLETEKTVTNIDSTWMKEYKKALFAGAMVLVILIIIFFIIRFMLKKRKMKKSLKAKLETE